MFLNKAVDLLKDVKAYDIADAFRIKEENPDGLMKFCNDLVLQHRHADTLMNSRLHGFLIANSVLIAAYAQFLNQGHVVVAFVLSLIKPVPTRRKNPYISRCYAKRAIPVTC